MAEKRKLAFYIRLSDADEEVKAGTKDESNSITGQRKLLYAYIKKTEEFAGFEVLEYFDESTEVLPTWYWGTPAGSTGLTVGGVSLFYQSLSAIRSKRIDTCLPSIKP